MANKQYGLIIPNKSKLTPANEVKRASIFDEDSADEEEERPTGLNKNLKRQDRITIQKAVEEDPTIYQYDELYDGIEQKRKESKAAVQDQEKKPKYINRLLAAADKRKRENERRIERQVQKECDAEGEEFKDKESFVTSAYRKKLEEFKKMEEEERREEYLEKVGDVTKQGNLDGFYRHLYDQKVNYEEKIENDQKEINQIENDQKDDDHKENDLKDDVNKENDPKEDDHKENDLKNTDTNLKSETKNEIKKFTNKRKYRQRKSSKSDDESEDDKKMEHLPSNLDADSDFSIDSDSEGESESKKIKKDPPEIEETEVENKIEKIEEVKEEDKKENDNVKIDDDEKIEEKIKKPKVDVWKKRTVGVVFDEALQRYFERKSLRESMCG